jgi:hypothetical protein
MQGYPVADQIMQWMVDVSGLPVSLIGKLYRMGPVMEHRLNEPASDDEEMDIETDDGTSVTNEWSAGR